jgi:hypothetical protein
MVLDLFSGKFLACEGSGTFWLMEVKVSTGHFPGSLFTYEFN